MLKKKRRIVIILIMYTFNNYSEYLKGKDKVFISSIFIYYNESALIHSIWYLVDAEIGIAIGSIINKLANKNN